MSPAPALAGISEEDFIAAYREHFNGTVHWLGTQGEKDAEGIAQQAWMKAWQHRDQFHGMSSIFTWVVRIAWNEMRQTWRGERRDYRTRRCYLDLKWMEDDGQWTYHADARIDMDRILSRIQVRQADLLWLRFAQELSYDEMGLGCKVTVWRKLTQATQAARRAAGL